MSLVKPWTGSLEIMSRRDGRDENGGGKAGGRDKDKGRVEGVVFVEDAEEAEGLEKCEVV